MHQLATIWKGFLFIFYLVPPLFWDCSLCWDHFEGGTDAYTCPALPCGSRAGADLGQTSGSEDDASPIFTS